MFVSLEGGDGVGKSTTLKLLSAALNGVEYSTPPKSYLSRREKIDKSATDLDHYIFYKDGVLDASLEIKKLVLKGKTVVCDRYWLSTYTYHEAMGLKIEYGDFDSVVKPDLTVLLSLGHTKQIDRIIDRGMSAGDKRMIDEQKKLASLFYSNALKFDIPFIVINTDAFNPEKVVSIILEAIKGLK